MRVISDRASIDVAMVPASVSLVTGCQAEAHSGAHTDTPWPAHGIRIILKTGRHDHYSLY